MEVSIDAVTVSPALGTRGFREITNIRNSSSVEVAVCAETDAYGETATISPIKIESVCIMNFLKYILMLLEVFSLPVLFGRRR